MFRGRPWYLLALYAAIGGSLAVITAATATLALTGQLTRPGKPAARTPSASPSGPVFPATRITFRPASDTTTARLTPASPAPLPASRTPGNLPTGRKIARTPVPVTSAPATAAPSTIVTTATATSTAIATATATATQTATATETETATETASPEPSPPEPPSPSPEPSPSDSTDPGFPPPTEGSP